MLEINRYKHNILQQKKEKGGITAISVAAKRVFTSSLNKLGHSGSHSLRGTLRPLRCTEFGKKVNIVHRGLSLQALTHIRGARGSQKAPTE